MIVKDYGDYDGYLDREVDNGFVLTRYVFERFMGEWDEFGGSLGEFITSILEKYQ